MNSLIKPLRLRDQIEIAIYR
ncbi:hypothetical protein SKA58_12270 [Sphingomonas sp. SKA58]|nr:hypothetical protein SKA58_12270 [Sphingomonas sp. SKA58]